MVSRQKVRTASAPPERSSSGCSGVVEDKVGLEGDGDEAEEEGEEGGELLEELAPMVGFFCEEAEEVSRGGRTTKAHTLSV